MHTPFAREPNAFEYYNTIMDLNWIEYVIVNHVIILVFDLSYVPCKIMIEFGQNIVNTKGNTFAELDRKCICAEYTNIMEKIIP